MKRWSVVRCAGAAWLCQLMCILAVVGSVSLAALPDPSAVMASPFATDMPVELIEWMQQARATSPHLQSVARELEIARSKLRANLAAVHGSVMNIHVPVEATPDGVGGGATVSLRQVSGNTTTEVNVGAAAGYQNNELRAAPTLGLEVRHVLGSRADVPELRYQYEFAAADETYHKANRKWSLDLIKAYGAAHVVSLDAQIAEARLVLAKGRHEAALDRERAGAATATELYLSRQAVTRAQASVEALDVAAQIAVDELHRLTGVPIAHIALDGRLVPVDLPAGPAFGDEASWVALALEARSDLAVAGQAVRLAEAELSEARRLAGIVGQVRAGVVFPDKPTAAEPGLGWYVGAGFSLPLRDVGQAEAVVQATLQLEQAHANEVLLRERIRTEVQLAYQQHELSARQFLRALDDVTHANHLLEVAMMASEAGLGTEWDVAEARIHVAEAERAVHSAYYDVLEKRISLWHMAGRDVAW